MNVAAYPWYASVSGDELQQGDILEACPVFMPPDELVGSDLADGLFQWEERDVIVLTQSCDLVAGREKVSEVLLCPLWNRSEITEGHLASAKGIEEARRGNVPGFHLLAACSLPAMPRELRVVDFRRIHTLPIGFARRVVANANERLLPPYREHMAQAFARYFMRIGLPLDIPPFK